MAETFDKAERKVRESKADPDQKLRTLHEDYKKRDGKINRKHGEDGLYRHIQLPSFYSLIKEVSTFSLITGTSHYLLTTSILMLNYNWRSILPLIFFLKYD